MSESHDPPEPARPPGPPDLPRRVRLYPAQWVGIPLLVLIPVLAVFGVFDLKREHQQLELAGLRVDVEYPTRMRHGQHAEILVHVRNRSGEVVDSLTLAFDPEYLHHFQDVSFTPSPTQGYEVEVVGLEPGRMAVIRVVLQGFQPWRQRGRIEVQRPGADAAHLPIETFVLP